MVYAKRPFGGPKAVLAYLSRYTHRVAISNRRLVAADDGGVSFRWKDYRIEGPGRWKTMTLTPHEFIRRFLMHVLPAGFHLPDPEPWRAWSNFDVMQADTVTVRANMRSILVATMKVVLMQSLDLLGL